MEYINNTLCITHTELTSGIMTVGNLHKQYQRGRIERAVRGGNGREAMYIVDSLPLKYRNEVYRRNPDFQRTALAIPFADTVITDGAAYEFYRSYTYSDGKHLPASVVDEYVANASIFNRFTEMLSLANSHRQKLGAKRLNITEFWQDKATFLPLVADTLGHSLPTSYRKLQAKYNAYMRDGYKVFISRKYANVNAAKIKTKEQESLVIRILADPRNLDNEQVAEFYNFIASQMVEPWQPITGRAVGYIREKHDLTTAAARRGSGEFYNNKAMQFKRSAPTAPLLYWSADGWDVELLYQTTRIDNKGHRVTTYSNRVTMVVILDAFNKYPIGYAIGDHETPELIKDALKNAADHTRELFGERYRTCQFQSDRYGIKTLTPIYAVMGDKVTPARAHNAKAKVIEPYFNYLNKHYCQWYSNWSGFGITSRKDKQPNWESQNKMRHEFPDLDGVIAQINEFMTKERAAKRAEYLKGYELTPADRRLPLSTENYLLTFGSDTGRLNAIEGQGLRPTIGGIKCDFDCFDPAFRRFSHVKWSVKYDPSDLGKALAVSEDGTLRFMLESKYVQPMALADRKEGDSIQMERVNHFNKMLVEDVTERIALASATTERLVLENPNLRNTLAKTLIVNSLGQHKDERNNIRHRLERGGDDEVFVIAPKKRKKVAVIEADEASIFDLI